MKTKNNLTTGILIGIGVIVLPLILMSGKTNYVTEKENIYEIHHVQNPGSVVNDRVSLLLNTRTGDVDVLVINKKSNRFRLKENKED